MPRHGVAVFQPLPFYDIVRTVGPTSSRSQDGYLHLSFTLLADAVGNNVVLLRPQECSCWKPEDQHTRFEVAVNYKRLDLPKTLGVLQRRRQPIDITASSSFHRSCTNAVDLTWPLNSGYTFMMCIVERVTPEKLVRRIQNDSICNANASKALLKAKLSGKGDADVLSKSIKVSLLCPIGRGRITVPVRPKTCNHIQCFDALQFLKLNEPNAVWTCPFCNKPVEFESLQVDALFSHILSSTDSNEIVFNQDGSWDPVQPKIPFYDLCTPQKPVVKKKRAATLGKLSVIDLTGDTTDEEVDSCSKFKTRIPVTPDWNNNDGR